jgi:multidrug resistance efflux pump
MSTTLTYPTRADRRLTWLEQRAGLRGARKFERARRRALQAELSVYRTQAERNELLTLLENQSGDEADEIRQLLAG